VKKWSFFNSNLYSLDFWNSNSAINVNLSNGTASGDHADGGMLIDIKSVYGSKHNDTLIGDENNNSLVRYFGNDILSGNDGHDYIEEGGNDHMFGGSGSDRILGGLGNDMLRGDSRADRLNGGSGNDYFIYSSLEDSSINASDIIQDF
jgi:Ca2+-binding RTX toxin-like protein